MVGPANFSLPVNGPPPQDFLSTPGVLIQPQPLHASSAEFSNNNQPHHFGVPHQQTPHLSYLQAFQNGETSSAKPNPHSSPNARLNAKQQQIKKAKEARLCVFGVAN